VKRKIFLSICLTLICLCWSEEIIDLNFYNELKIDFYDFVDFKEFQETMINDSIPAYNIFTGRILKDYEGDIFTLAFLNYIKCDLASPTDYLYKVDNSNLNFNILASNINSDSLRISPFHLIEADSLKIGIFSIYTPDFVVKNEIGSTALFDYNIFQIVKAQAEFLSTKANVVIMISNLSKYIDKEMVKELPVDIVLSSDYLKKTNGMLNDRTRFYSVVSEDGKFGKLRLTLSNGKVDFDWQEDEIILPVKEDPQLDIEGKKDAGSN